MKNITNTTLNHIIENKYIPNSILFYGPRGNNSLQISLNYIKQIFCTSNTTSCNSCSQCHLINEMIHPDLYILTVGDLNVFKETIKQKKSITQNEWLQIANLEKQAFIDKDSVLQMQQFMTIPPTGQHKVTLIVGMEYIQPITMNTLLKIIEEPPIKNSLFVMTSDDYNAILPTILSRTIKIYVSNDIDISFKESFDEILQWFRACYKMKYSELLPIIDNFAGYDKEKQKALLISVTYMLSELWYSANNLYTMMHSVDNIHDTLNKIAKTLTPNDISNFYLDVNKNIEYLRRNVNPKLVFMNLSQSLHKVFKIT